MSEVHSDLWAALTQTPRPFRLVDFPREDPVTKEAIGQVAIWVLTQAEQSAAAAEADKMARRVLKEPQSKSDENLGYENIYANEATVQVLFRACRDPNDITTRAAFPSPGDIRSKLTVTEIGVLMSAYIEVQSELGPLISRMTKQEMDLYISRIAEAGQTKHPLYLLSPEMKNDLIVYLVDRCSTSSTVTSSAGSPLESTETES